MPQDRIGDIDFWNSDTPFGSGRSRNASDRPKRLRKPRTAPSDQQFKATHVAVQVQSSLQLDLKLIGEVYGC